MNLIVGDLSPGNRAASGDQVRAPLEDKAEVPQNENADDCWYRYRTNGSIAQEGRCGFKKDRQAEDKKYSQRNEKAIAVRRNARPVGIGSHEVIEDQQGAQNRKADGKKLAREQEKSDGGEQQDRRPGEQTVIR